MKDFNRNIFTDRKSIGDTLLDYALALVIALCLTIAALSYFDILFI